MGSVKHLILPRALSRGATVGICSPSGPVCRDKLEAAAPALEKRGHSVVLSPTVFDRIGYLAGNDEDRLAALYDMFERRNVDAVFASRGGYGASRILARVDCSRIAASRKPFVGFSDLTALQWLLFARDKFVTFSGPLAVEWAGGVAQESLEFLLRLLSGDISGNLLHGFPTDGLKVLRSGRCEGTLLPGNLTLIASLSGTPFLPALEGSILVLEEVGEPRYRLDRLLFHLRNAGVFERISGLLIGDMTHGAPNEEEVPSLEEIVLDATAGFDFPILFGIPYGHGAVRVTLPVGVRVRLDAEKGELSLLEPVVEEKSA
jgi:muramoyltetrapeptide carboxypeptidase